MKAIVVDDEALILKDILRQLDKISMIESAEGFSNPLEALESLVVNDADVALLVWDWGWANDWAEGIIERLPAKASLVSVSE